MSGERCKLKQLGGSGLLPQRCAALCAVTLVPEFAEISVIIAGETYRWGKASLCPSLLCAGI